MKKKQWIVLLAVVLIVATVAVFLFVNPAEESGLPKMYFEGNIAEMNDKKDVRNITVKYEDGENSFEGYATLKVQGTSSLAYDKKNYTIKFYSDADYEESMGVDVGWGEQSKYCLKANWVDKTHARNVVTANIVTQVQEKYGLLEQAPERGAVDGFPIEIYSNGKFLGLYTFNIPKDAWMFGMDEENPDHIVICGEGWEPANLFNDLPDFETWAVEVGEESDETLEKMNRLFDFIINSTDEEFKVNFEQYLDLDAALNYYVVSDYAYLMDNRGKNMLIATYDGQKWFLSLYDMDRSWGVDRGEITWDYENELTYMSWSNLLARMETCFGAELSDRYFELREDILTKDHVMDMFESFEAQIPASTIVKERMRWGMNIPGRDISQIGEYLESVEERLDQKYTQLGAN